MNKINLQKMVAASEKACALMKVLSNQDRMMILCEISQKECCVSDIESELGIAQPTLSQQLTVLRNAKLVKTRKKGKQVYYTLSSPQVSAVMETLYEKFCKK